MLAKKGDWIKAARKVYVGCNSIDFFCIVKIESLIGSMVGAKYFIKNGYGRYIPKRVSISREDSYPYFSVNRKAYSNEIFASITDFKVSPEN